VDFAPSSFAQEIDLSEDVEQYQAAIYQRLGGNFAFEDFPGRYQQKHVIS